MRDFKRFQNLLCFGRTYLVCVVLTYKVFLSINQTLS